jgi:hypothetical protein
LTEGVKIPCWTDILTESDWRAFHVVTSKNDHSQSRKPELEYLLEDRLHVFDRFGVRTSVVPDCHTPFDARIFPREGPAIVPTDNVSNRRFFERAVPSGLGFCSSSQRIDRIVEPVVRTDVLG